MKEGMKMPGFTAEASLYKPRRHYNHGVNRSVDGQVIIPQAAYYAPCSVFNPDLFDTPGLCFDACLRNPLCSAKTCAYACIPWLKNAHDLYYDYW